MATTSTIGTARQALVDALDADALAGNVFYAWPGPDAERTEIVWVDRVSSWTQEIPNIKAGRKQRQESYTFELVFWVVNDKDSDGAKDAFERALEMTAVAENKLADDVQLGETSVQLLVLEDRDVELVPVDRGWGCQIILRISGQARLK